MAAVRLVQICKPANMVLRPQMSHQDNLTTTDCPGCHQQQQCAVLHPNRCFASEDSVPHFVVALSIEGRKTAKRQYSKATCAPVGAEPLQHSKAACAPVGAEPLQHSKATCAPVGAEPLQHSKATCAPVGAEPLQHSKTLIGMCNGTVDLPSNTPVFNTLKT
jgi:hypothetical protein